MKLIPLTQGFFAKVDDADYPQVSELKWFAHRVGQRVYAGRNLSPPGLIHMHVFLMRPEKGLDVLHGNGDGLDNQRGNLKVGTREQNLHGFCRKVAGATSKFRGVFWRSDRKKWSAQIRLTGVRTHLGNFVSEVEAAKAFDAAAFSNFGEYAQLNFPLTPAPALA